MKIINEILNIQIIIQVCKPYENCQWDIEYYLFILLKNILFIRERKICCSTHLCIRWVLPVYALTRDQICNLGVSGWFSNQLSYLPGPRAESSQLDMYFALSEHLILESPHFKCSEAMCGQCGYSTGWHRAREFDLFI